MRRDDVIVDLSPVDLTQPMEAMFGVLREKERRRYVARFLRRVGVNNRWTRRRFVEDEVFYWSEP